MVFALMGHMLSLEQNGTLSDEIKEHEGHEESSDKMCNADWTCYKASWGLTQLGSSQRKSSFEQRLGGTME